MVVRKLARVFAYLPPLAILTGIHGYGLVRAVETGQVALVVTILVSAGVSDLLIVAAFLSAGW